MIVTFFLKLETFFINYFGKLDTLINTLAYVRHFDILCINKMVSNRRERLCLCQLSHEKAE
jgi:hypothetical protein